MVRSFIPSLHDIRALLRLAIPIATVQVGLMLMSVVDTMIVGHVSARELAAAALGNLYFYGLTGFGMGTVWAIDPVVSQALGAGDREAAALGMAGDAALGREQLRAGLGALVVGGRVGRARPGVVLRAGDAGVRSGGLRSGLRAFRAAARHKHEQGERGDGE